MGFDVKAIDWKAQIFPKREDLPRDLTSFDILKSLAVVLMVIDHVGWLLFPQYEWFRVLGRLCVPIWFFLIGYSDTRSVPVRWYIAGGILAVASIVVGISPMPLSVLFTMAIVRFTIESLWRLMEEKRFYFWGFVLLLGFFGYVSDMFVEYGTIGLLLAFIGHIHRHREEVEGQLGEGMVQTYTVVALTLFGGMELLKFGFSMLASMVLAAGLLGMIFVLQDFRPKTLPNTANSAHAPLIRFMGRYTLEIYVIHLLILKGVYGLKMLAVHVIG
jgi:hypothetical protein